MGTADGMLVVTMTWVVSAAFSAIPFLLAGTCESFTDAYFEVMSGYTTTGATLLTSIESNPLSILFWRSETNWLGGMGIVVLFVAFLPMLGVKGTMLVGAESVGPTKDKLTPKIGHTAAIFWELYLGLSLLETILLLFGGLSLYEAVTVTFSTMAAAGFCVKNNSIGTFGSAYVDIVVTIFMMFAGANFALYYKLLQRKGKSVLHDAELQGYVGIFAATSLLSALVLTTRHVYGNFFTSLRYSAFQTASILTTTGFATADYLYWPQFCQMLLFLLFFVGGCSGSAGGGIKVIRVQAILKMGKRGIFKRLHPNAVVNNGVGGTAMSDDVSLTIGGFVGMYIATGLIATVIVSLSDADFTTCIASVFLCLGNIGIGFGKVGPTGNFAFFPDWCTWIFSFLMLVGRLELFTVYALFTKSFWAIRSMAPHSEKDL
jgi:trk system potassium uptake protein TrkH